MSLKSALEKQRQKDLSGFKVILVYIISSRPARATQRNLVSKIKNRAGEMAQR